MNLPLELQRRFDRRWSARFGMPERGSQPDLTASADQSSNAEGDISLDEPTAATPREMIFPSSTEHS
jgi:hypothetical protein